MHLKLVQKEKFKKQQKQLVSWLVVKFLIKSQKSQEVHHRIIQKQLDKSYNGKITKVSKNLEAVTIENDKKTPKERYMSPEKRQEIIDDLRLIIQ